MAIDLPVSVDTMAVRIKEAAAGVPVEIVAVSVGPGEVDESLRKCLAKGADRAIRVWD